MKLNLPSLEQVEPRPVLLALGGVLALAVLLGWTFLLRPAFREYTHLHGMRARAERRVRQQRDTLNAGRVDALQRRVSHLQQSLDGSGAPLPSGQLLPGIIRVLDGLAKHDDVEFASVKPGAASKVLLFYKLPFDVVASGDYFHLFAWLRAVERELHPMVVEQFRMTPSGGGKTLSLALRLAVWRVRGGRP